MAGSRRSLLVLCTFQLITTVERQVFDFLGFMWAPIFMNFLNILFVIFGFFGVFQYVTKYIYSYATWNLLWLMWNIFLICYYLNIGVLNRDSGLLALGTGSVSWWEVNGYGCKSRWDEVDSTSLLRPTEVEGCLLHFSYIETLHAGFHCFLGFLAVILGFYHAFNITKSDDNHGRGSIKSTGNQSLYSVEFTRPPEIRIEAATKPMTPRRVKRRSVSSRHSTRRSSRRSSHRRNNSHHSNSGHTNPTYRQSSQNSLNDSYNEEELYNNRPASVRSNYSNFHAARPITLHMDTSVFSESNYHHDIYLQNSTSNPPLSTEATPQVPQKRIIQNTITNNNASYRIYSNQNAFLNNGPPAYHLHQSSHFLPPPPPPPENETVM